MPKVVHDKEVTREEAADQLETLAEAFRGDSPFDFNVGNQTIELSPPQYIVMEIDVQEKSTRSGGERESVTVKFDWQSA